MNIYYWPFSTPSLSVLMVAEAAGLKYQKHLVNLKEGEQRNPDFLEINPMGKVPALVDGEETVTESMAIQRYLARKAQSDLYPDDLAKQTLVDKWTNFTAHEVRTPVLDIEVYRWVAELTGQEKNEGVIDLCMSRLDRSLPVLDLHLAKNNYLTGESLTIADIALVSALDPVDVVGIDISAYGNVRQFLDRGRQTDWYQAVNKNFGAELGL